MVLLGRVPSGIGSIHALRTPGVKKWHALHIKTLLQAFESSQYCNGEATERQLTQQAAIQ